MYTESERVMLTGWDGHVFELLPHDKIAALPADDRRRYEERLHGYDLDNEGRTDYYSQWTAFRDRCKTEGCVTRRYENYRHCLTHISIDDIDDPADKINRRSMKAKLRMAELLERGVDELEKLVTAHPEELAPQVRLKALTELFDRANLPRQTAQSVDHTGSVEMVHTDAAAIIQGRLDRLAASQVDRELTGIEMATVEAEVIEDGD
jgi:hypothetical protein